MRRHIRYALAGLGLAVLLVGLTIGAVALCATAAHAAPAAGPVAAVPVAAGRVPAAPPVPSPNPPSQPAQPVVPGAAGTDDPGVTINVGGGKPSNSIVILLALTVLSVAPALLLLCTSFTKVFVVLSVTRNALGLTNAPPNQVIAGLALFLSLFIMGPTFSDVNEQGIQPYLHGEKSQSVAFHDGVKPLRDFMLDHTRKDEIALFTKVADRPMPKNRDDVPLEVVVPAFALSELRAAFIIGFVIFIPFLVIDMVVASALMSLGMMMLPPVTVSLPFKLLLFVLVNGWGLVVTSLVASYQ